MSDPAAGATTEPEADVVDADAPDDDAPDEAAMTLLGIRSAVGGVLMGLANLVPGISGGTMLLASGIYPRFIRAISEISTLKFRKRSMLVLGVVAVMALAAIVLLAGSVKSLVVDHRWIMYSLFIGLTLGGVPLVWKMAKPADRAVWIGFVVGAVPMAVLAYHQMFDPDGASDQAGFMMMFLAGVAAASAMILPGVSGSYLLLVLGVYVPILGGVDAFKEALKAGSFEAMKAPLFDVVVPVGLGVAIGIVVVSNVLERLLKRYEKGTLGGLLGLLVGAVVGLWPFRVGVAPEIGDVYRTRVVTEEILSDLTPDKYPTEFFSPSAGQVGAAIGLVVAGFVVTGLVARLGAGKDAAKKQAA